MATFTVTNTDDSGAGSLRDAINQANTTAGDDVIIFQSDLTGTITLASELSITEGVTITGTGSDTLSISGGWSGYEATDGVRLFNVSDGNDLNAINITISNLKLTGGHSATSGGAIFNQGENLNLVNLVIYDNKADSSEVDEGGGGVFNQGGTLTVVNSSIIANYGTFGGGIANAASGTVSVINSLIVDNRASFGGGIYSWDGSVTLNSVTVAGNVASDCGGVTNDSGTLTTNNSILALNYTQDGVAFDVSGAVAAGSKNNVIAATDTDIPNGTNGNIVGPVTGLFTSNPDAGLDAAWGTTDDVAGDYHLAVNSVAIDKGDSSLLPADTYDVNQNGNTAEVLPVDMDNEARIRGTSIDIGAFEYEHTPPTDPVNLTQTVTGGNVVLDWNDSTDDLSGIKQYTIEIDNNSSFTAPASSTSTASDFNQTGLTVGTHYWRVRAEDNVGNVSDWSVTQSFVVKLVVTNLNDSGAGSLRSAIDQANANAGADAIEFQSGLSGIITLTSELLISDDLTITGLGSAAIAVSGNNASRIFNIQGVSSLNVTISGLTLNGGKVTGAGGGAILNNNSNLTLDDLIISNSKADNGAGIYNNDGTVTLLNSMVKNNVATVNGGGIYSTAAGSVLLNGSTLYTNGAVDGGGLYTNGDANITSSLLSGNTASGKGAGIDNLGTLTLNNSTLYSNAATGNGGAIYNADTGVASLSADTITANSSAASGDGIFNDTNAGTNGILKIRDTILSGNNSDDLQNNGSLVIGGAEGWGTFNLLGTTNGAAGLDAANNNITGVNDPKLGPLQINGSMTPNADSAAINAGIYIPGLSTDVAGKSRAGEERVDIGSTETNTTGAGPAINPPAAGNTIIVTTANDNIDADDGFISLREAIIQANSSNNDTITFKDTLAGSTILLTSNMVAINKNVTITGLGKDNLTISGGWSGDIATDGYRIFNTGDNTSTVLNVTISGMTLTNGYSSTNGGAILNRGENLTLIDMVITGSKAESTEVDEGGGGIFNQGGSVSLVNSFVTSNTAAFGGGIANSANGTLDITNSLIADNRASFGGGIYSWDGSVTITNATIAGNAVSSADGGGITNDSGTLSIYNSIIALNYNDLGTNKDTSGNISGNSSNNLIGATYLTDGVNGNIIGVDPLFFSNPDAGFDGTWGTADDVTGDYHLTNSSPAIDGGNNAALPADIHDIDQDGNTSEPLPVDLDGINRTNNGTIDIGAYESIPPDVTPPTVPENLTQTVSVGSVSFNWDDSTDTNGISGYTVEISTNSNFTSIVSTLNSTQNDTTAYIPVDGVYYWRVSAQDSSDNSSGWSVFSTFSVDLTPPSVPDGLKATSNAGTITLDWNDATDNPGGSGVSLYQIQADDNNDFSSPESTLTSSSSDAILADLAEGSYFWRVRTQDNDGNWSEWSTASGFDVDLTPPSVPDGLTQIDNGGGNVSFDWNDSTDPSGIKQYEIKVDNNNDLGSPENTSNSATSNINLTILSDGNYFWQVRAQDNAGNWSNWSTAGSFSIDATPPSVPDGLTDAVNISSVSFDWNDSTDPSGIKQYEIVVDNNNDFSSPENTLTSSTSDAALSGMAEGSYFWRVRTQDNSGNWSAWSDADSFAIDLTPPSIPDGLTKMLNGGGSVSFDWNDSTDPGGIAQYEVQVDNSSNFGSPEKTATSTTSEVTITGIAEGSYFWRVRSQDNSGNWSNWSTSDTFDLDNTAPTVPGSLSQIVSGGNNVAFDWADSTDARTGMKQYQLQVDNNNNFSSPENTLNPVTSDASLSGMADGSYFWRVRALDNAGNWSAWSTSANFSIDITAPSIPVGLTQTTNLGNVALDWTDSSDNVSGVKQYEVQVDNNNDFSSLDKNATSATSDANLSGLADGSYFWRVRTQDNSGNWSAWSAAGSFDIDLVPPTVPLNLSQNVTGTDVSMNWDDATDARSGVKQYQLQVDNNNDFSSPEQTGASLTSDFTATGLAEGTHYWRVRTQDNNGNWSAWSSNSNFIVDLTAPSVPAGMTQTVTGSNVALNWDDASDALAGVKLYQVQLDNNADFNTPEYSATPAASATNFGSVADGNYYWRIRTQDNSGNWSTWSAADSLTVDTTGPAVPVNLTKKLNGHSVDLDWNDTTDALSGLKQYEVQVDTHEDFSSPLKTITANSSATTVDSLLDGKYFWRVRAQDNFDNWSTWSAKATFSVYFPDFTPPTVPVGLNSAMADNALSLKWGASTDEGGIKRYQIQVDKNKNFSAPVITTLSETTSALVNGLSDGTYNWRVRAQDNAGNWSNWSTSAEFKASFDLLPPSVPVGLKQISGAGTASLDWDDSKDARSGIKDYEVQIDNNANFSSPEKTATAAISKATVSGLAQGSYFWRVRAQDNAGHMSSWSKVSTLLITPFDTAANDWRNAKNITDGVDRWVGIGDAADCYKLVMTNAGTLTLGLTGLSGDSNLSLLDSYGRILKTSANRLNAPEAISANLLAGNYYVKVAPAARVDNATYTLTHAENYCPADKAANTWQAAKDIAGGVDNWVGFGDAADFYKVSMATAGTLTLNLTGLTGDANLTLLDSKGRVLKTSANGANKDEAITANLFSGTYYVNVAPVRGVNNAPYTLTSVKQDCPADTAGNSFETALKVTTNGTTAEWLGFSDKFDYYKFELQSATSAQFNLTGLKSNVDLYLYDARKRQIATSAKPGSNNEAITKTLAAGTYYVAAKLANSSPNTDYSLAFVIDAAAFKAGSLKMFSSSSPLTSGSDSALSNDPLKKNQGMLAS